MQVKCREIRSQLTRTRFVFDPTPSIKKKRLDLRDIRFIPWHADGMPEYVSPAVQRLARQYVDGQRFASHNDVLLFSMSLLSAFEAHYQSSLGESLSAAFAKSAEGTHFYSRRKLEDCFDDIIQAGRTKNLKGHGADLS